MIIILSFDTQHSDYFTYRMCWCSRYEPIINEARILSRSHAVWFCSALYRGLSDFTLYANYYLLTTKMVSSDVTFRNGWGGGGGPLINDTPQISKCYILPTHGFHNTNTLFSWAAPGVSHPDRFIITKNSGKQQTNKQKTRTEYSLSAVYMRCVYCVPYYGR